VQGLLLTCMLGACFTCVQAYEYAPRRSPSGPRATSTASTFFMATGFHGFHVLVGTMFLIVCLFRAMKGHFKPTTISARGGGLVLALRRRGLDLPVRLHLRLGRRRDRDPLNRREGEATDWRSEVSPYSAGLRCRCPRCGQGRLFKGLLTVRPVCDSCGLDLSAQDSGDGPAVFVILIVGFAAVLLSIFVETAFEPPTWVHLVYQIPFVLGLSVLLLRPLKATLIALQYRHRTAGFE
jgi:uncharacterized protein (DUF983 family)